MTIDRCPCGKRTFRDRIAAQMVIANAARKNNGKRREARAYRCEHGRWHVTSRANPKGGT